MNENYTLKKAIFIIALSVVVVSGGASLIYRGTKFLKESRASNAQYIVKAIAQRSRPTPIAVA